MRLQQGPKLSVGQPVDQFISQVFLRVAYGRHLVGASHIRCLLRTQQWHFDLPDTD
jgi:hypothetical protein